MNCGLFDLLDRHDPDVGLRASMLVVRGSDRAMASVWSDQMVCFNYEGLPLADADGAQFLAFGDVDHEINNYDEVRYPAVAS